MHDKNPQKLETPLEIVTIPTDDKSAVEIIPFGSDERIRLTVSIIRKMIAVPTRTGKLPDDTQCIKFMMLCRARHLNPFDGDAYFLGYDTQTGPQFSLITAHQVFLKRAEASKGFNGMESGVIVRQPDHDGKMGTGPILEREGDLVYDDEKLVGGWAKVFRKDREKPFYRRLKLATFNTGRSRWEKDPAGMICKCAEADALRTAFPTHLGGLYIEEEPQVIDSEQIPIKRAQIRKLNDRKEGDATLPNENAAASADKEPSTQDSHSQDVQSTVGSDAGSNVQPAEPAKKKRTLKKKDAPSEPAVGPNESQMIMRLAGMERTKEQLVQVAKTFDALLNEQGWSDIGEDGFATLMQPDNWPLIESELKAL